MNQFINKKLNNIFAIAGSGVAAQYVNGIWHGSLDYLNPSTGYWMVTYENAQFQFSQPDYDVPPRNSSGSRNDAPDLFTFTQSPYHAFYWIANADIDELKRGIKCLVWNAAHLLKTELIQVILKVR